MGQRPVNNKKVFQNWNAKPDQPADYDDYQEREGKSLLNTPWDGRILLNKLYLTGFHMTSDLPVAQRIQPTSCAAMVKRKNEQSWVNRPLEILKIPAMPIQIKRT
jgi:hypothetical protein